MCLISIRPTKVTVFGLIGRASRGEGERKVGGEGGDSGEGGEGGEGGGAAWLEVAVGVGATVGAVRATTPTPIYGLRWVD